MSSPIEFYSYSGQTTINGGTLEFFSNGLSSGDGIATGKFCVAGPMDPSNVITVQGGATIVVRNIAPLGNSPLLPQFAQPSSFTLADPWTKSAALINSRRSERSLFRRLRAQGRDRPRHRRSEVRPGAGKPQSTIGPPRRQPRRHRRDERMVPRSPGS